MKSAELRFTGRVSFLGRVADIRLNLSVDRQQLLDLMIDLLNHPDELPEALQLLTAKNTYHPGEAAGFWLELDQPEQVAEEPQPALDRTETILKQLGDPSLSDAEKWILLAEANPAIFGPDDTNQADPTSVKKPPANLDDIRRLARKLKGEPDEPLTQSHIRQDVDLSLLRPHLATIIKPDHTANKSEIARLLNLSPGGANNWPYIQQLAAILETEHRHLRQEDNDISEGRITA